MGTSDEFGHFPDVDSNIAPSDLEKYSIAPSASEQVIADITTQSNLRRIAEHRASQIQARCDELQRKLNAAAAAAAKTKKRKSTQPPAASASARDTAVSANPKKRRSPPKPLIDVLASQRAALHDEESGTDTSDEVVPSPDEQSGSKQPTFEGLNSVLCEYKKSKDNGDGSFQPTYEGPLTFTVCAEMADDEANDIDEWSYQQKIERRPMIVSALRLVYKNKKEAWFSKPFLMSPMGAAEYWQEVLKRRATLWREAHKSAQQTAEAAEDIVSPVRSSVHRRLREKLKKRSSDRTAPSPPAPIAEGNRLSPISISSDPEDLTPPSALSQTSKGHTFSSSSSSSAKKTKKSAPPSKSYTRDEIKRHANMAKTIRNVDESRGHSLAVADFVDLEFSGLFSTSSESPRHSCSDWWQTSDHGLTPACPTDNTGMMAKARRSKDPWTKNRFESACAKAVRIMEERSLVVTRHNLSSS